MNIGITGEMGSGKSTVTKILAQYNFKIINTDEITHLLYKTDLEVIKSIKNHFGFNVSNNISRKALAKIIFNNPKELNFIENLIHPKVDKYWIRIIEKNNHNYTIELPLLFEKKYEKNFDKIIYIHADESLRYQRLIKKGFNLIDIKARKKQFLSVNEKIDKANIVIFNNGNIELLKDQIKICIKNKLISY